jgi:putative ABC transport system permease protein
LVPIARRNILADKVKFLVAVGGVTLSIVIIIVMQSLYQGVRRESTMFINSLPGDLWVTQRGTTNLVFSNSHLPEKAGNDINALDGVRSVYALSGRLMAFHVSEGKERTYVMALQPVPDDASARPAEFTPARGQIIVDRAFAKESNLEVGDELPFGDDRFRVSEVRRVGNVLVTQFALVSPDDYREVLGTPNSVNYFLVSLDDPSLAPKVSSQIENLVPGSEVFTTDAFAKSDNDTGANTFLPVIRVVTVISFIVGLAVLSLTIYSATIERVRDYAVLKAIGASPLSLYRVVLSQSLLISSLGFMLGVGLAFVVNSVASDVVPNFVTYVRWQDLGVVLAVTAVMSFVASYLPLSRVARIDPAAVFRA